MELRSKKINNDSILGRLSKINVTVIEIKNGVLDYWMNEWREWQLTSHHSTSYQSTSYHSTNFYSIRYHFLVILRMEIVLGITILAISIAVMAIGVIFNNKPLSGSCGGLNPDGICTICGGDPQKCENSETGSVSV